MFSSLLSILGIPRIHRCKAGGTLLAYWSQRLVKPSLWLAWQLPVRVVFQASCSQAAEKCTTQQLRVGLSFNTMPVLRRRRSHRDGLQICMQVLPYILGAVLE